MNQRLIGGVAERIYIPDDCVVFRKTSGEFGGLSNMAPGFPLEVNGIAMRTSEVLYQAFRFPHLPEVQRMLFDEKSPMTAKMRSKPYRKETRPDWEKIRVRVMRWCLRVKLTQNWHRFAGLLQRSGDKPIVEFSKRDAFWGAKPTEAETLAGANVLGRLLMELRQEANDSDRTDFDIVMPPDIKGALLLERAIEPVRIRTRPRTEQLSLLNK